MTSFIILITFLTFVCLILFTKQIQYDEAIFAQPIITECQVSTTLELEGKAYENIVGKGENAVIKHFLVFPIFLP